jgi:hypothetical protein
MSILIGICVAVAVAWFGFKIIGKSETPATLKWPWSSRVYWIVLGGAVAIIAVVNALPPTPQELAAQEQAKQAEARHDYLLKKDHLTHAECLEFFGPDADKPEADGSYGPCQRVDVDEALRRMDAYDRSSHDLIELQKADEARKYFGIK